MATVTWRSQAIIDEMVRVILVVAQDVGLHGVHIAKANTPVRTGLARNSVHMELTHAGTIITIWVGSSGVRYFLWIEIGARGRPGKAPLGKAFAAMQLLLASRLRAVGFTVR